MIRLPAIALIAVFASATAHASQRVFVASYGSDANTVNNCSFLNPCRGFTAAMTVVDDGGEVVALDAAGYGAVAITQSVSIVANPGFYAGITAGSGSAVTIATANVTVLLRGLNINGTGAVNGVLMTNGSSLTIDNCVISNFNDGIQVDAATAQVKVANSVLTGNTATGMEVRQGRADVVGSRATGNYIGFSVRPWAAGTTAKLTIADSSSSGNSFGFVANDNGYNSVARLSATRVTGTNNQTGLSVGRAVGTITAVVGNSMFTENTSIGFFNSPGGTLESLGNNIVRLNGTNTQGIVTTIGGI